MKMPVNQADQLYTASIKTFWPGYQERKGDSERQTNNRLAKINEDFAPDFASIADQQAEVRRIQRSDYAKKHWPKFAAGPDVRVVDSHTLLDAWTSGEENHATGQVRNVTLSLPTGPWGRSRAVLLHEIAHAIERYEYLPFEDFDPFMAYFDDGHGPRFAKLSIEVVRQFYSKEMGDKLEANYRDGGVEIAA